jgi:hypothetical protein
MSSPTGRAPFPADLGLEDEIKQAEVELLGLEVWWEGVTQYMSYDCRILEELKSRHLSIHLHIYVSTYLYLHIYLSNQYIYLSNLIFSNLI